MSISYRVMSIDDYDEMKSLWMNSNGISFSESDTLPQIQAYLQRNPNCSWVAMDEGRIVGTILAGEDARRGFINHLYVTPQYRKQKIADHLLTLAEQALSQQSPTKAYIFVENTNTEASQFWKKHLYQPCDDFIVMRKPLTTDPYRTYVELTEKTVPDYLSTRKLCPHPISHVEEIGDGNMNHIFKITAGNESIILKQSMPHGKIDTQVFEPMERAIYEGEYMDFYAQQLSEYMPKHIDFDRVMCVNVYQNLSEYSVLRDYLLQGNSNPSIGIELGNYLATELCSSLTLPFETKKQWEGKFANPRMRELTEDFVLLSPFKDSPHNTVDKDIRPIINTIWSDHSLYTKAQLQAYKFITDKQCLISGDFHPGNVFIRPDKNPKCIFFDFDFATWGPISYDIGTMLGNLIIALRTNRIHNPSTNQNITQMIDNMLTEFRESVSSKLPHLESSIRMSFIDDIIRESYGYSAATIGGRTYGYARFKEIKLLDGHPLRKEIIAQLVLDLRFLMLECHTQDQLVTYLSGSS